MRHYIIVDLESAVIDRKGHQRYLKMERFVPSADGVGRRGREIKDDPLLTPRWVFQTIVTAVAMICREHEDGNIDVVQFETFSAPELDERGIVEGIFKLMARLPEDAEFVSYGGVWHDTPVLTAAALRHGLTIPPQWRFLAWGGDGRVRHVDLCRALTGNSKMKLVHLAEFAAMLDLPAKMTQAAYAAARLISEGDYVGVQEMCESDVITTALLFAGWKRLMDEKVPIGVAHDRILRHVEDLRSGRSYVPGLREWREKRFKAEIAVVTGERASLAPWLDDQHQIKLAA
jgi:3'-5' exonuclease